MYSVEISTQKGGSTKILFSRPFLSVFTQQRVIYDSVMDIFRPCVPKEEYRRVKFVTLDRLDPLIRREPDLNLTR
ncbi:unnamed protein product [Mycena citricolor]|uniref:Uncharacterized protein n=1 Tax=Mycena citricolor TaxID=2018698 RepID=A0AAD2HJD5_9AGAR|nr:unnamed protein product [Mycena citricolor]